MSEIDGCIVCWIVFTYKSVSLQKQKHEFYHLHQDYTTAVCKCIIILFVFVIITTTAELIYFGVLKNYLVQILDIHRVLFDEINWKWKMKNVPTIFKSLIVEIFWKYFKTIIWIWYKHICFTNVIYSFFSYYDKTQ